MSWASLIGKKHVQQPSSAMQSMAKPTLVEYVRDKYPSSEKSHIAYLDKVETANPHDWRDFAIALSDVIASDYPMGEMSVGKCSGWTVCQLYLDKLSKDGYDYHGRNGYIGSDHWYAEQRGGVWALNQKNGKDHGSCLITTVRQILDDLKESYPSDYRVKYTN